MDLQQWRAWCQSAANGQLVILDVRSQSAYDQGHVPAAYAFPWVADAFERQLSGALRGSKPPMGIFGDATNAPQAKAALDHLGLSVQGVWDRGMESWMAQELPVVRDISVGELYEDRDRFVVVDIREPHEHADGIVPGAMLLPMGHLPRRLGELDPHREYALICRSGSRSLNMSVWLALQGFRVHNVLNGMNAWMAAGYPLARPQTSTGGAPA